MKLSPEVIEKIMNDLFHSFYHGQWSKNSSQQMKKMLSDLDLVVHDSSQSTLVENK